VGINWKHVAVWQRGLVCYAVFVGVCLVLGAHLKPRPDEIIFALTLPLWAIIPYAAACLILAATRLWLVRGHNRRRLVRSLVAKLRANARRLGA
jgi:hypothetical protein